MTTLSKHLPALLLLAIVGAFSGSLAAIAAITGPEALGLFGAALVGVSAALGFKIGATAAASTTPPATPTVGAVPSAAAVVAPPPAAGVAPATVTAPPAAAVPG